MPRSKIAAKYRALLDEIEATLHDPDGAAVLPLACKTGPTRCTPPQDNGRIEILLDRSGRILSQNAAASQRHWLEPGEPLAAIALSPQATQRFLAAQDGSALPLLVADPAGGTIFLFGQSVEPDGPLPLTVHSGQKLRLNVGDLSINPPGQPFAPVASGAGKIPPRQRCGGKDAVLQHRREAQIAKRPGGFRQLRLLGLVQPQADHRRLPAALRPGLAAFHPGQAQPSVAAKGGSSSSSILCRRSCRRGVGDRGQVVPRFESCSLKGAGNVNHVT